MGCTNLDGIAAELPRDMIGGQDDGRGAVAGGAALQQREGIGDHVEVGMGIVGEDENGPIETFVFTRAKP